MYVENIYIKCTISAPKEWKIKPRIIHTKIKTIKKKKAEMKKKENENNM